MFSIKQISAVLGIIIAIVTIGGFIAADRAKFASASDVLKNREEIRYIHKRYVDDQKYKRAEKVEKRIWWYERTYANKQMTPVERQEYENLKIELNKLRREGY